VEDEQELFTQYGVHHGRRAAGTCMVKWLKH